MKTVQLNPYTLLSYRSAIQREKENLENNIECALKSEFKVYRQLGELHKKNFDERLKGMVKSYFEHILCTFDEEYYQQALQ